MEQKMKRRQFLTRSVFLTGGLMLGSGGAVAGGMAKGMKGFEKVDSELFAGVNRVKDSEKKTALEKKHAPLIEVPEHIKPGEPFAVTVTMGEVMHPMSAGHFIEYVELYVGNEPAGRCEFRPEFNQPRTMFQLVLDKPTTLVAREYCNLHGLWESRLEISPA